MGNGTPDRISNIALLIDADNASPASLDPVLTVLADGVRHAAIRAGAPYDFVVANILLSPLKRLAHPVRALLARRATVVLSGLMPDQENAARAAWCTEGLVLRRRQVIDNWVTLTLER